MALWPGLFGDGMSGGDDVGGMMWADNAAPAASGELVFTEHLISNDFTYSYGLCPTDIDGDGDIDLVSSDAREHGALYWFENDGTGNFKRHTVFAAPQDMTQELVRMERHVAVDMNRDGHPDVVIVDNKAGDSDGSRTTARPKMKSPGACIRSREDRCRARTTWPWAI